MTFTLPFKMLKILCSRHIAYTISAMKIEMWFIYILIFKLPFIFYLKGISTTTPVCVEVDGMDSPTTIPNNELTVDDSSVIVGNLRPSSPIPLKSTKGTLMIEYLPQTSRPIGTVELVSTS